MESASFLLCKQCSNKTCLKTGRPCDEVEKLLPKDTTGRLKGESNFSGDFMDRELIQLQDGSYKFRGKQKKYKE